MANTRKRKQKMELSVPTPDLPAPTKLKDQDAAPSLPITIDPEAFNFRIDRDAIKELDIDGYRLLQRSPIVQQPMGKAAMRLKSLDLVCVSPSHPGSEYHVAMQKQLDNTHGLHDVIEFNQRHGYFEGVTFTQIKPRDAKNDDPWIYADVKDGCIHREECVPDKTSAGLRWDRLKVAKRTTQNAWTPEETNKAKVYDKINFIVFHPGSTTNTNGNLTIARICLPLCASYERCQRNVDDFIDTFPLPYLVATGAIDSIQADKVGTFLNGLVSRIKGMDAAKRNVALANRQQLMMLEPQGTACIIMMDRMKHLEGQAHMILLGNELTSSTKESGPSGSSGTQSQEEDKYITGYGRDHCIAFEDLRAWQQEKNPDLLELKEEDEDEVYYQFQPEGQRAKIGLEEKMLAPEVDLEKDSTLAQPQNGGDPNPVPMTDDKSNQNENVQDKQMAEAQKKNMDLLKKNIQKSLSLSQVHSHRHRQST